MRRVLLIVAGVSLLLLNPALTTRASFHDSATVRGGTAPASAFTSGAINAVATPTLSQTTGTGVVNAAWTATTLSTGLGAQAVSGYELYRWSAASGGTGTLVCTRTSSLSCNASRIDGTWYYEVRARVATSWVRGSARQPFTSVGTGTALVTMQPTDFTGTAAALRSLVNCPGGIAPGCGTSTDPNGAPTVAYSFLANPNFSTQDYCWNGTTYVTSTGTCPLLATVSTTSGTTTTWALPGNEATAYQSGFPGYIRLIITSTDVYGNVTTVTFILTVSG